MDTYADMQMTVQNKGKIRGRIRISGQASASNNKCFGKIESIAERNGAY